VGDADLFAGGSEVDAGAPVQPVRARREAVVPAGALVELTQQHQEFVGGGMQARCEDRNLIAEGFGGGGHAPSSHRSFCRVRLAPVRRLRADPSEMMG
jgi:hypothetical protein